MTDDARLDADARRALRVRLDNAACELNAALDGVPASLPVTRRYIVDVRDTLADRRERIESILANFTRDDRMAELYAQRGGDDA